MNRTTLRHPLFPLLVLGVALALAATVHVPPASAQGANASLQINFGAAPHWGYVPGTRVREIRQGGERPDYDMFRYGNAYYAYNNNHWYSSRNSHGEFRQIEDRNVPNQIQRVPREHWRNYPSGWGDRNNNNNGHDNNGHGNNGQGNPGNRDHK